MEAACPTPSPSKIDIIPFYNGHELYSRLFSFLFSTMMCYKWSTRICLNQDGAKEECKLSPKSTTSTQGVSVHDGGRRYTLYSPGFNRPNNYNRFFCIYNITLNCPGHKVNLAATERTTPFQADCNDYLAIYTDRNSRTPDRKICGRDFHHYRTTLDTNHFHGVFWTDYETSPGRFEIEATCAEPIPTTSTSSATTSDEGSAAGDIIGDNI